MDPLTAQTVRYAAEQVKDGLQSLGTGIGAQTFTREARRDKTKSILSKFVKPVLNDLGAQLKAKIEQEMARTGETQEQVIKRLSTDVAKALAGQPAEKVPPGRTASRATRPRSASPLDFGGPPKRDASFFSDDFGDPRR